ncbi:MAG: hypothetical protein JW755_13550 [Candidatus Aminicenantes bacterium]|nr:hypothetical protein [Candidatus Aminicenantes bacterium]
MDNNQIILPEKVGLWSRSEAPKIVDQNNIFDYMNGAGELYLGYRFKRLEVYEYSAGDSNDILVELYYMDTPDDAFGLLSLDWEGEPVSLSGTTKTKKIPDDVVPSSRALYGQGLMRIWADKIYARILAFLETPESRDAVFALSRAVFTGRKNSPVPEIVKILPAKIENDWSVNKNRTSFFRSYLVLNSLYYISHQNILDLGLSVEGITTSYRSNKQVGEKEIRLIYIRYESLDKAWEGMNFFLESYLPEENLSVDKSKAGSISNSIQLEDGWMGYSLNGSALTLVFESPEKDLSGKIITKIGSGNNREEGKS